ncbi:metallophosphoesterase [Pleurocapsa sp. PCC 7319]|uniref:metallophosphoesterase family protein n=1 Tax=Pleurocapsa sp. PCC 7319 TaxID=118161 RepID=UPI00037227F1|nr:metallophosphoesterase [Pleurocapsa sp. PCC 7319]
MKISKLMLMVLIILMLIAINYLPMTFATEKPLIDRQNYSLLSDPFLQLPTKNTVNIVWFTEFQGDRHLIKYGAELEKQVTATTTKLSQVREDEDSQLDSPPAQSISRDIWRHEATVGGLIPNQRLPYQVVSIEDRQTIPSNVFTLASNPTTETSLKILLTSDHQLKPMTTANLAKVVETVGQVDAVFFPGDLVDIPDRASEWFDDRRGGAFFPSLQGRANYELESNGLKTIYKGGEIIQHAPLFTAVGNHEVMGRSSPEIKLKQAYSNSIPRKVGAKLYQQKASQINPTEDPQVKVNWIKNNSFSTDTYEEIFSLPQSATGGKLYYATTFGDIRLISLYVTNIWRSPSLEADDQGRYKESTENLENPEAWGYGQHIFEPIAQGSPQYKWLTQELQSEAYQQAKYKIVMLHHPPHTLGGNIVPPFTEPRAKLDYTEDGKVQSRYYDYPIEEDYIIRDLIPLLESAGVQLVYYGHSHLWNRFQSTSGMHFLESSNVGNSYGAHLGDNKRPIPFYSPQNYAATGNPNGLEPIVPNIAPLIDESGQSLPYIASNDITVFSIFDTQTGTVSSYRYDTRQPNSEVVKFDEFKLTK